MRPWRRARAHPGFDALGNHGPFQAGVGYRDIAKSLAERAGGVRPGLLVGPQSDPPVPEIGQGVGRLVDCPKCSVQAPDQEQVHLALGDVVEEPAPGFAPAQVGGAGKVGVLGNVGPALGRAEVAQGQALGVQVLAFVMRRYGRGSGLAWLHRSVTVVQGGWHGSPEGGPAAGTLRLAA